MKRPIAVVSLLICLALALTAVAQVSGLYDLSWHVIGGGGGRMESPGGHQLRGTAGQSLTGAMQSAGAHALCSGYWPCGVADEHRIFLPLVARNAASPQPALIFSDDFDDGQLTGWTANRGTWTNPGKEMRGEYAVANAWNIRSSTGDDLVYTGTISIVTGNGGGLTFRSSADGTSSYDLILDTVHGVVKISKRPPYQVLASYPITVEHNRPYTLKVVANGSTLEGYVDGVKRLTVTDTTYTDGRLGVILFCTTATYDDLEARHVP
jgi:hypothetical protein